MSLHSMLGIKPKKKDVIKQTVKTYGNISVIKFDYFRQSDVLLNKNISPDTSLIYSDEKTKKRIIEFRVLSTKEIAPNTYLSSLVIVTSDKWFSRSLEDKHNNIKEGTELLIKL